MPWGRESQLGTLRLRTGPNFPPPGCLVRPGPVCRSRSDYRRLSMPPGPAMAGGARPPQERSCCRSRCLFGEL
eukprot:14416888-Alexandrium_andersonii.AAC.1